MLAWNPIGRMSGPILLQHLFRRAPRAGDKIYNLHKISQTKNMKLLNSFKSTIRMRLEEPWKRFMSAHKTWVDRVLD